MKQKKAPEIARLSRQTNTRKKSIPGTKEPLNLFVRIDSPLVEKRCETVPAGDESKEPSFIPRIVRTYVAVGVRETRFSWYQR